MGLGACDTRPCRRDAVRDENQTAYKTAYKVNRTPYRTSGSRERETGFEPATSCLEGRTKVDPRDSMVVRYG